MEREYQISITAKERKVIKNLLEAKIKDFNEEIFNMRAKATEQHSYIMEIGLRKQWIKKYHNLIKKLYSQ